MGTYEAIADVLVSVHLKDVSSTCSQRPQWSYPESPVPVIYTALECILASAMQQEAMSISKFSRWMRAICFILLSKNRPTDRVKALSYIQQAVEVLKDHTGRAGDLASVWSHILLVFLLLLMPRVTALSRRRATLAGKHCIQYRCGVPIVSRPHFNETYS